MPVGERKREILKPPNIKKKEKKRERKRSAGRREKEKRRMPMRFCTAMVFG